MPVHGWFFVSYSERAQGWGMSKHQCFGQEWVLFRAETGEAGVVRSVLPASRRASGARRQGRRRLTRAAGVPQLGLQSPGWCTRIPYAQIMPRSARQPILKALPVTEKNGIVWAWYHPWGARTAVGGPQGSRTRGRELTLRPRAAEWPVNTFIQELGENGVDFAHL